MRIEQGFRRDYAIWGTYISFHSFREKASNSGPLLARTATWLMTLRMQRKSAPTQPLRGYVRIQVTGLFRCWLLERVCRFPATFSMG